MNLQEAEKTKTKNKTKKEKKVFKSNANEI